MRKVLVFQHVAHEILGTLNPLLKQQGFRIRYVNFDRHPDTQPTLERYNGLIVLGGYMGVYEAEKYTHIKTEMKLIEEALRRDLPILGICLGAQMLANVLGADVRKNKEKEIGWYDLQLTEEGRSEDLFSNFQRKEKIFQLHGDTFDIPSGAKHLASSELCLGQAFKYGSRAYGLQFHLEVDAAMIKRWLAVPSNKAELARSKGKFVEEVIMEDTKKYIAKSVELSRKTFSKFIDFFGLQERPIVMGSGHGKPRR